MSRKLTVFIALLLVSVLVFACGKPAETPAPAPAPQPEEEATPAETAPAEEAPQVEGVTGKIVVVGSTSVSPTIEKLAADFMENVEPGVTIEVQSVGSSAGIKAAGDGTGDIGMASRNIKEEEKALGLDEYILGFDGIAVVTHPSNEVKDLSSEQIQKIFAGEITNWSEVGGKDVEIIVVSREEGSGTRGAFEELMGLDKEVLVTGDAVIAEGNGAVKAQVASKEDAIGYLSLSYLDETVQQLKVDGVEGTPENIKDGSYKVSRPFLLLTKPEKSEAVEAFFKYFETDNAKKIIEDQHLILQ
ncbi:MAG: phosphate ABC transporter substrate-binding protein [Tissierellia bacterium]|nr:phosphate ABC transporter substrate-binding protein [Bacillota bacterium]NLL23305.1 phosphate ABC transporter substrate-binding protein [Tissierellia bacterium]